MRLVREISKDRIYTNAEIWELVEAGKFKYMTSIADQEGNILIFNSTNFEAWTHKMDGTLQLDRITFCKGDTWRII